MTPAQAAQQSNRDAGGRYQSKAHAEADVDLTAHTGPFLTSQQLQEFDSMVKDIETEFGSAVVSVRWEMNEDGRAVIVEAESHDGGWTEPDNDGSLGGPTLDAIPPFADDQGVTRVSDLAPSDGDEIEPEEPEEIESWDSDGTLCSVTMGKDGGTGLLYADFEMELGEHMAIPKYVPDDDGTRREYLDDRAHLVEPVVKELYGQDAEVNSDGDHARASRRFGLGTSRATKEDAVQASYNGSVQFLNDITPGSAGGRGFHRRLQEAYEKYDRENSPEFG